MEAFAIYGSVRRSHRESTAPVPVRKGRARTETVESSANEAMRAHVLERPHSATVYGLVAAMQSGRFTVEDLIEFLEEGPNVGET